MDSGQEHPRAPDQPQPRRARPGRPDLHHPRPGRRGACSPAASGLTHDAIEVDEDFDFWTYVVRTPDPGRPDRLPDLRRGPVLHRATRSTSWPRSSTSSRSTCSPSASSPTSAPQLFAGSAPARRARRPDERAPGRGAVLVRQARHPQRPHRERRDGHRGRGDRRRRRRRSPTRSRPTWPTRCSAASTTAAGSPPPGPRRSAWPRSRCPSAERSRASGSAGERRQSTSSGISISSGVSEPCRPTRRRLVGEVGGRHDRGVAARRRRRRRPGAAAPPGRPGRTSRGRPPASRVSTSARSPRSSRQVAATSSTAPRRQ